LPMGVRAVETITASVIVTSGGDAAVDLLYWEGF